MHSDSEWSVLSEEISGEETEEQAHRALHESDEWSDLNAAGASDIESLDSSISGAELMHFPGGLAEEIKMDRIDQIQNRIVAIDEDSSTEDIPSDQIPSVNIEDELRQCRERILQLESELKSAEDTAASERKRADSLKNQLKVGRKKIQELQAKNAQISRDNTALRNRYKKDRKRNSRKVKSKYGSLGAKGHHRPSVPAKLRYRRGRTTHRTVIRRDRKW